MIKLTSPIPTLLILAVHAFAFADDPIPPTPDTPPIPVPVEVTPVTPAVTPTPIPAVNKPIFPVISTSLPVTPAEPVNPAIVPTLLAGRLFVIQSPVKFKLFVSDSKLVNIRKVKGPRDISGVFADGDGSDEDRTYAAPFIAIVKAEKNQSGLVKLIYDPNGSNDESEATEILLLIGAGPRPPPIPPGPIPDPNPPTPPVPPTPAPTGFRVLFIYNTTANLSREQYNILYSTKIVDYLNAHCVKVAVNGRDLPEWRKWSPNVKIMPTESRTMVDLWNSIDHAKIADKLPQIVIAVNGAATTYQITTADTEQSILAKLKAAGGE